VIFSAEMTALQARSAIRVFPGILVIQIVVAVVLGPLLGGERWSSEPLVLVALVASLAVVATRRMGLLGRTAARSAIRSSPAAA
jgi:hypothetical protein